MKYDRFRGSTSNMVRVFIPDNTSVKGAGKTGLTNASTNLTIAYMRELDSASTVYTGANIEAQTTIGSFQAPSTNAKCRFKEVDSTNFPGVYEIQFHDTATIFGTGDASRNVQINIFEATTTALNIGPNMSEIRLIAWDMQTALASSTIGLTPASILAIWNQLTGDAGILANTFGAKLRDWVLGTDKKALISADAQDLSATLSVNAKLLAGAVPNNLAAGAQMDLVNAPNATGLNAIADAFLKRDWTAVTGEAARSVLNALRKLRNKVSFNGVNTLTIYKEDDATPAYTQTVVEDAAQTPFKSVG